MCILMWLSAPRWERTVGKIDCNEWMCLQSSWQSGSCVGLCAQWRTLWWAAPVGCFQNLQLTEDFGCWWRNNSDTYCVEVYSGWARSYQCCGERQWAGWISIELDERPIRSLVKEPLHLFFASFQSMLDLGLFLMKIIGATIHFDSAWTCRAPSVSWTT